MMIFDYRLHFAIGTHSFQIISEGCFRCHKIGLKKSRSPEFVNVCSWALKMRTKADASRIKCPQVRNAGGCAKTSTTNARP